jgi:hypothetical protein
VRALTDALTASISVAVITNPQLGAVAGKDVLQSPTFTPLLKQPGLVPAFIVATQTTPTQVAAFLRRYSGRPVCFVHLGVPATPLAASVNGHAKGATHVYSRQLAVSYSNSLKGSRVALQDSFVRMSKNASYPKEDFFSDAHLTFAGDRLAGFSDYSIVGDFFTESGGPPHAVAIHLHYEQPDGLWVRHFVSDRTTGSVDTPGKFAEALAKLDAFAAKHPKVAATAACVEFRQLHRSGHFPGLGAAKELSLRHHFETVATLL